MMSVAVMVTEYGQPFLLAAGCNVFASRHHDFIAANRGQIIAGHITVQKLCY